MSLSIHPHSRTPHRPAPPSLRSVPLSRSHIPSACPQPWRRDSQGAKGDCGGLRGGCCFFNQLQCLSSKGFVAFGLGAVLLCADPRPSLAARGLCRVGSTRCRTLGVGLGPRAGGQVLLSPVWGVFPGSRAKPTSGRGAVTSTVPQENFPSPGVRPSVEENPNTGYIKQNLRQILKKYIFPTHPFPTALLLLTLSPSPPPTPGAGSIGTDAMLA